MQNSLWHRLSSLCFSQPVAQARKPVPHQKTIALLAACACFALAGCAAPPASTPGPGAQPALKVLAVETFLADMAQNVAGERLKVEPLLARNVDPHSFEPAPGDVRKVAECNVLIVNGAGLEAGFLNRLLQSAGGKRQIIEAAAGLTSRTAREGELVESGEQHHEGDPHFWLNPLHAIHYVENIRDGLSKADPQGAKAYAENAEAYIARLRQLDSWIAEQVQQIPEERRKLVTNHESFGYYADRYGFTIIGTVIPSVSTDAAPSAQQVARLVERIKQAGVKAIFLETGSNPHMAQQIARETGIKVVTELYTHSTTDGPPAPTYIDMLRYDTQAIVAALK